MPRSSTPIKKVKSTLGRDVWEIRTRIPMADGSRRQIKRQFPTLTEAKLALDEIKELERQGVRDSRQTVAEFLEEWLAGLTLDPPTIVQYQWAIRRHLIPAIGHRRLLKDFNTGTQVAAVYAGLKRLDGKGPLRTTTKAHLAKTLHVAMEAAVLDGKLPRNPCDLIPKQKRITPQRREMKVWSQDEAVLFVRGAMEDDLYLAMMLMLARGMRPSEVVGLWWPDVDFHQGTLSIQRALVAVDGNQLYLSDCKSKGSRRMLSLDAHLVELLQTHRVAQKKARLLAGPAWQSEHDWVFTWMKAGGKGQGRGKPHQPGDPIHGDVLANRFKKIVKRLDLPEIRLYDLRHTAATLALMMGAHVKVVSEMLGHSRTAITQDIYFHTTPGMHAETGAKLTAVLQGAVEANVVDLHG